MKRKSLIIAAGCVVLIVAAVLWKSRPPAKASEHQGHEAAHDMGEGTLHVSAAAQQWDPLESTCRHASLSIL